MRTATIAARLSLKVVPHASREALVGWMGEVLKVAVTAPPERGKANAAVEDLLARVLGIDRRRVTVVSGHTAARKIVEVVGLSPEELRHRLEQALSREET